MSTSLRTKLNDTSKQYISKSSFHGVPKVVSSDSSIIRKIFWLLIVLASIGYCSFTIFNYVSDYLKYEVVTNYHKVYESRPVFPVIEICGHDENKIFKKSNNGHDHSCQFNGKKCELSSYNGYLKYKTDCLWFNADPNNVQRLNARGPENGLKLALYTSDIEPIIIGVYNYSMGTGILKRIRVSRSMETDLIITSKFTHKLGPPYSNCQDKVKVGANFYPYNQEECYEFCQYTKVAEICGFSSILKENTHLFYARRNNFFEQIGPLINKCQLSSFAFIKNTSYHGKISDIFALEGAVNLCKECSVKVKCTSISYLISAYSTLLLKSNTLIEDLTKVNMYYESFEFTMIADAEKTEAFDLMASIGGIVSLFLGMSLMSFLEIGEIFFWLLWAIFDHICCCRQRRSSPDQNPILDKDESLLIN